jgi:hypothetical protein
MSHNTYHGDAARGHNFWVYPRNHALITPKWDTYDANDLCNNYTLVDTDAQGLKTYKCNGHSG